MTLMELANVLSECDYIDVQYFEDYENGRNCYKTEILVKQLRNGDNPLCRAKVTWVFIPYEDDDECRDESDNLKLQVRVERV